MVTPAGRSASPFGGAATVTPERGGRRDGATLVEASVTARLLGMKLLTLDAKVALVPAEVTVVAPRRAAREPAALAPALVAERSHGRGGAAGHRGLADAVRDLGEGAKLLAEVQRRAG